MASARENEEHQHFLNLFEANFVHKDDVVGRRQQLANIPLWVKERIGQKINEKMYLQLRHKIAQQKIEELERKIRELLEEGEGMGPKKRRLGEAQMAAALAASKGDVHAAYRMLTQ